MYIFVSDKHSQNNQNNLIIPIILINPKIPISDN